MRNEQKLYSEMTSSNIICSIQELDKKKKSRKKGAQYLNILYLSYKSPKHNYK